MRYWLLNHPIFAIIVTVLAFLIPIVALCAVAEYYTCTAQTEGLGTPHRWGPMRGCQVQIEGRWIPLDNCRWLPNGKIVID